MQIGFTSRFTRSGTACCRIACLSLIDRELSIMNSRSILSTDVCVMRSTKMLVVTGSGLPIGRSRHADARPSRGATARVNPAIQRPFLRRDAAGSAEPEADAKPCSDLLCIKAYLLLD